MSKTRALEDLKSQQAEVSADAEQTHQTLLDKQVELRKLYYALVRAESEKAKDESGQEGLPLDKGRLGGLSQPLDELLAKGPDRSAKRLKELADVHRKERGARPRRTQSAAKGSSTGRCLPSSLKSRGPRS